MEQKKKVLIITYYWPPSGGASVQRWLKLSKYLVQFHIEPIILTVDPKYAAYPQRDDSFLKEVSDQVIVYTTKSFEALNLFSILFGKKNVPYGGFSNVNKDSLLQKIARFIRGNFFIPDARVGWNRFAYSKAKALINKYNIKSIITTSPPHSSQLIGLKLKKKLNIKWIADFNDPWTDIYYYKDLYHIGLVKKIDLNLEKKVLINADHIITNCESNKDIFLNKTVNKSDSNFSIVPNGFDHDDFKIPSTPSNDEFVITFTGTMADSYNPDVFLESLAEIKENNNTVNFRIKLIGNISEGIRKKIKDYELHTITDYEGYVIHNKSVEFLMKSTVLLNIFPQTELDNGVPGKLCEYLAAKKPIISISNKEGDSAKIIEESNSGKAFSREMKKELTLYLQDLVNAWKDNTNLDLVNQGDISFYSRKSGAQKIATLI